MSESFRWTSTFGSRCRSIGLLCLLAFYPQAEFVATGATQKQARAAVYLPQAITQIQTGLAQLRGDLRRAIVLARQQPNHGLLADFYYAIGDAYRKTGERMIARRYFEAAYEIDAATGNRFAAGVSELKLGSLAREAGDPADAARRHRRALAQFDEEPATGSSSLTSNSPAITLH